jgi:hypothetical protein
MRRALLAAVLLAVIFSPAAAPAAKNHVLRANGLTVAAPRGWHITRERLTECSSPTQVMAVTDTHGRLGLNAKLPRERTLVLVLEDRGYQGRGFPPRKPFTIPARIDPMGGCCEMPFSRGFELTFRDHGRNFYAFVYTATRPNAQRAVAVLNTLEVG